MPLTNLELYHYNKMGLIPGPAETEEAFQRRVEYCLNLAENLPTEFIDAKVSTKGQELLFESFPITEKLFDIKPAWVPVIVNNEGLMPWHGGAACIFQQNDSAPMGAFLQLREAFRQKKSYLGIYSREELIAHESAHIGRMAFEEPIFEELIAYQTAKTGFRRFFGSIIASGTEALLFFSVLLLSFFIDFLQIYLEESSISLILIEAAPLILLVLGILRQIVRQGQFRRARIHLSSLLGDEDQANGVLFRLTDSEIVLFSKLTPFEIKKYIDSNPSFRWRVIKSCYLS